MEDFVSFHLCLSVGIMIVSPSVSLIIFQPLRLYSHRVSCMCVFSPLTPPRRCWLSAQNMWHCPSFSVQPFEPCVGGSKLSIKCFCWGREKIWYSGETKVIWTRKFNCLSPVSLSFSLASPPNQFHMKAVQMRFNLKSVLQPVSFCSLWAPA